MDQQDIQNKVAELPNEQVVVEEKDQAQQENEVNLEPQEKDNDGGESDSGYENDDYGKTSPPWAFLTDLIADRALEAVKASREVNATRTPAEHHAYFRTVFERMREEAAARDDIPNAVTEEPLRKLRLRFIPQQYSSRCHCCFDFENFPQAIVRANPDQPGVITKDQVLEAICATLHPFPESEGDRSSEPSGSCESSAEPSGEQEEESALLSSGGDGSEEDRPSIKYGQPADFKFFVFNFAWIMSGRTLIDEVLFVFYRNADRLAEDFYLVNFGDPAKDDDNKGEVELDEEEEFLRIRNLIGRDIGARNRSGWEV
ncbi:hypothetical protein SLS62_001942 [Diatrype stigma]|uniref:Uncharacterized protein n=1 Tax=Diatrype stigma TaxID=117547 RepID=A0AAN9V7J3_9PEZI